MSSPKARVRVSQACAPCSVKKTKCDGQVPQCGICMVNRRTCTYSTSKRNTRLHMNKQRQASLPAHTPSVVLLTQGESVESTPQSERKPCLESLPRADVESLFRTYFMCIHPIWPLLYKPMYNSTSNYDLARILPKSLVYAMFAIASCINLEQGTSQEPQPQARGGDADGSAERATQYFHAALLELQRPENDHHQMSLASALKPSIANCQTLTVLAMQQHGVGEFSSAFMLCSLAAAMAVDLRLHRNTESTDAVQKEVASRLWWNVYILEKMLAIEMGRPVILRAEDCDAAYPSISEADEYEFFAPLSLENPSGDERFAGIKLRTISALHTTIELTVLLEKVIRDVYSLRGRELLRQDRSHGDRIRLGLSYELDEWQRKRETSSLSLGLFKECLPPPAVVTNYVVFQSMTILVHRPFITHWEQHREATGHAPFNTPDPAELCFQSCKDICLFLEKYSDYLTRLPSDLIFLIFMVTESLFRRCHQLDQNHPERIQIKLYLGQCLYWLGIFAKNWRNARARQQLLTERYDSIANLESDLDPNTSEMRDQIIDPIRLSAFDMTVNATMDEAQFAEAWNEMKEWGFLPDAEAVLYAYDL